MKKAIIILFMAIWVSGTSSAQPTTLLIDDFEGPINGGTNGTVDFGAGNGSSVEVSADTNVKYSGSQSLKASYLAMPGGTIWIARGYGLAALNSSWLVKPEDIAWNKYGAVSFYMKGSGSGAMVAFDVRDYTGEFWRFLTKDNQKGWIRVVCPFREFAVLDAEWQPTTAIINGILDFPLWSYQFAPLESQGVLNFDTVALVEKE